MRFEVPQFIDIEDKIFGPLTFKQFVYLAGGVGGSILAWIFIPKIIAVLVIAILMGLAGALAFYKVNNKPFINFLESAFRYSVTKKLYIWKKEAPEPQRPSDVPLPATESVSVPRLSDSKLRDLAWSLDVHDSLYSNTTDNR